MDFREGGFFCAPRPDGMKPFVIAVFFSGLERSLAGSGYNTRVDELRSAAYALKAYAGMEYAGFAQTNMRDVPDPIYHAHGGGCPNRGAAAEHWFSEMARVEESVEAWRKGDIEAFGRPLLCERAQQHENWQTGSPELIQLYEIMTRTEGIYGGAFFGRGLSRLLHSAGGSGAGGARRAKCGARIRESISAIGGQIFHAHLPQRGWNQP